MIRFLSPKYASLHQPLRKGLSVDFVNGQFNTEDPILIQELRDLIAVQLSGGLATIQEASESEGTRISGIIHLELDGVPHHKLFLNNDSLPDVMEKIKTITQIPIAQVNPNRVNETTPLVRGSVKADNRYTPDFAFGNAMGFSTEPAALPTVASYQSVTKAPVVKKSNPVRPVAAKKLRAKKGEKVNAS